MSTSNAPARVSGVINKLGLGDHAKDLSETLAADSLRVLGSFDFDNLYPVATKRKHAAVRNHGS